MTSPTRPLEHLTFATVFSGSSGYLKIMNTGEKDVSWNEGTVLLHAESCQDRYDFGVAIHTFPQPTKDPNRFKIWVKLAGDLLKDLSDEEIYHRKRICDIHFLPQHKTRNNRLSAIAVPSLQLPGTATENIVSPMIHTEMPSTSSAINPSNTVVQPGIATVNIASSSIDTDMPSTSSRIDMCSKSNYLRLGSKNKPASYITMSSQKQIKNLKRQILRLKKKGESYKTRLQNAEKLSKSKAFSVVTAKMSLPAKLFTRIQYCEANCEEDIATFLQSLNFFLDNKEVEKSSDAENVNDLPPQKYL
ncbi:hypothetical protein PYW07_000340 [Mythimna separata]|uniref:THAP-type domain-containing protein n=1 Tax=Mythimna separata TaxID=271217 RepID=A0AAD7Z3K3_MYTSE|nr:hypothetical protein PYW07_000340 [Mythimna separata]